MLGYLNPSYEHSSIRDPHASDNQIVDQIGAHGLLVVPDECFALNRQRGRFLINDQWAGCLQPTRAPRSGSLMTTLASGLR